MMSMHVNSFGCLISNYAGARGEGAMTGLGIHSLISVRKRRDEILAEQFPLREINFLVFVHDLHRPYHTHFMQTFSHYKFNIFSLHIYMTLSVEGASNYSNLLHSW
ncbi:hypothetical protein O6H91_Y062000 [Diphasiastrum complanatum]|nr:hypothetical protein O6H91_Y062000 [Diphasiastrum complanatum]